MKYFFLSLMLYVLSARGQSVSDTIFLDRSGQKTTHDNYTYFRLIEKEKEHYLLRDFTKEGILVMTGTLSSVSPDVKNGFFTTYYPSGEKYVECEYYNDKQRGTEKIYDTKGKLKISSEYKDGKKDGRSVRYEEDGSTVTNIYEAGVLRRTSADPAHQATSKEIASSLFGGDESIDMEQFKERLKQKYENLPDSIKQLRQTVSISYELDSIGLMTNIQPSKRGHKALSDLMLQTAREIPTNRSMALKVGSNMVTGYSIMVTFPDMYVATSMSMSSRSKPVNNSLDMFETKPMGSADPFSFFMSSADTFGIFLQHRFEKTAFAKDDKTVAEVSLTFELDKDGKTKDIKLDKRSDKKRGAFVVKMIKEYPKWIAKTSDGKNTETHYEVTVNFPGCTSTINSSSTTR